MRNYADRDGPATRQEILNTLQREPGLTKSQLCRLLQLSWGTISHHVALLEEDRLVVRKPLHGRRRLFLPTMAEDAVAFHSLARTPLIPRLLAQVRERPGIGIQALATHLSVDRRLIRRNLDLLIESGLLAQTGDYRPKFYLVEQTRANGIIALAMRSEERRPGSGMEVRPPN